MSVRAAPTMALCLAALLVGCASNSPPTPPPPPTERSAGHDETDLSRRRDAWIEQLHRAAPGTNWRAMDAGVRDSALRKRLAEQAEARAAGKSLQEIESVTLPGGQVGRWRELGSSNQAGRVIDIAYDASSELLFVASAGGNLWRVTRGQTNYVPLNDATRFADASLELIDGPSGLRILVGSTQPNGVFYSDNAGVTWNTASGIPADANAYGAEAIAIRDRGNAEVFFARRGFIFDGAQFRHGVRLFRSVNDGASFAQVAQLYLDNFTSPFRLFSPRYGSTELYALHDNQLSRIDPASGALVGKQTIWPGVALAGLQGALSGGTSDSAQVFLYVALQSGATRRLYRSIDGGTTWEPPTSYVEGLFGGYSLASSTRLANVVYQGGVDCRRSVDAGAIWTRVNPWQDYYGNPAGKLHADIPVIEAFRDGAGNELTFVGSDGGVYQSSDGLVTVSNLSLSGLRNGQYYSSYTPTAVSGRLFGGAQDQGLQYAAALAGSGLSSFAQIISGDYADLASANGGTGLWAMYPGFAMLYPTALTNQGLYRTWNFPSSGANPFFFPRAMVEPGNPNRYLVGGGVSVPPTRIAQLDYNGSSIVPTNLAYDFGARITGLGYAPTNSSHRYAINENSVFYHSSDGGVGWTPTPAFSGPPEHYFYGHCIAGHPVTAGTVYLCGSGYSNPGVWRSVDHGGGFNALSNGLPSTMIYDLALSANGAHLFAATEVGAYYFNTTNSTWIDIGGVMGPDQIFWDVQFVEAAQAARFSTYGRGFWDFEIVGDVIFVSGFQ